MKGRKRNMEVSDGSYIKYSSFTIKKQINKTFLNSLLSLILKKLQKKKKDFILFFHFIDNVTFLFYVVLKQTIYFFCDLLFSLFIFYILFTFIFLFKN